MRPTEVLELAAELEARFPVASWEWGGFHVWPVIRLAIATELDDHRANVRAAEQRAGKPRGLSRALRGLAALWRASRDDRAHDDRSSEPVDALLLTMTTARRFEIEGALECVFSDPLLDRIEREQLTGAVLEFAPGGEYRVPRRRPSRWIDANLEKARVRERLARDPHAFADSLGASFGEMLASLATRTQEVDRVLREATRLAGYVRQASLFFERVLDERRPAVAFTYGFYDPESFALALACRRKGVVAVDVQHGVVSAADVFYARWSKLPEGGFEVLPSLFALWQESDKAVVEAWAGRSGPHRAIVFGNLAAERFLDAADPVTAHFDQVVASVETARTAKRNVLLALQPANGVSPLLKSVLEEAPREWCFWPRLHPSMLDQEASVRAAIEATGARLVPIALASRLPVYSILRHVDAVITESSSVLTDALGFGVGTVITHATGADYFQKEIESGRAIFAPSKEEVLAAIEKLALARTPVSDARAKDASPGLREVLDLMHSRRRARLA